jgi:hypothetical protein
LIDPWNVAEIWKAHGFTYGAGRVHRQLRRHAEVSSAWRSSATAFPCATAWQAEVHDAVRDGEHVHDEQVELTGEDSGSQLPCGVGRPAGEGPQD